MRVWTTVEPGIGVVASGGFGVVARGEFGIDTILGVGEGATNSIGSD